MQRLASGRLPDILDMTARYSRNDQSVTEYMFGPYLQEPLFPFRQCVFPIHAECIQIFSNGLQRPENLLMKHQIH